MDDQMRLLRMVRDNHCTTLMLCPADCSTDEYRTISRCLTSMEKRGWITRSLQSGWRWSLTDNGQKVLTNGCPA